MEMEIMKMKEKHRLILFILVGEAKISRFLWK